MAGRIAILSVVLALTALSPVFSQDPPDEAALRARLLASETHAGELQTRLETLYLAVQTDFQLLRSPRFRRLAGPFRAAIEKRADALREGTEEATGGLAEDFVAAKLLTETIARRMAMAVAARAASLARGESMTPTEFLDAAVEAVFPKESFEDSWDAQFTDLPLVTEWRAASEAVEKDRKALQAATAKPVASPDTPPGMVLVPEGRYTWGPWSGWLFELKKNKAAKARIQAFYIDVHEVTNATWYAFLKGSKKELRKDRLATGFKLDADGEPVKPKGRDAEPARGMKWAAASDCAKFLGKRLPTEEEWEIAARGAKGPKYPWGEEFGEKVANTKEAGHGAPRPVGTMKGDVSVFGVMDMGGNVSEMTHTLADRRPVKGKLGSEHSFIYRGGNYGDGEEAAQISYRWTIRAVDETDEKVGFRCVLSKREWKKR